MSFFLGFLSDLLVKMLPWLFSGSTTTEIKRSAGLQDLDNLDGNADLRLPP
jgi:hypothetical protein